MKRTPIILIFVIYISVCFLACKNKKTLPILGEKPINKFVLLNQDSSEITNNTFINKVYIADFFFTSCTTICPIMHRAMKDLYEDYKNDPNLMFLSHTIDFKYDTPSVLKRYAQRLGVDGSKWQFAYGSKEEVYALAEKSYLVTVIADTNNAANYVHDGFLLLVDKHGRLRGAYDGTDKFQVEKLKNDLPLLLREK